jgi:hypothetical protein
VFWRSLFEYPELIQTARSSRNFLRSQDFTWLKKRTMHNGSRIEKMLNMKSAEQLIAVCGGIIKGLTNNPAFASPPVDLKMVPPYSGLLLHPGSFIVFSGWTPEIPA